MENRNNTVLALNGASIIMVTIGTFQALTWGTLTTYPADSRIIRAVLKERPYNSGAEVFRKPFNDPRISRGIFIMAGQGWRMSRAILRPLV